MKLFVKVIVFIPVILLLGIVSGICEFAEALNDNIVNPAGDILVELVKK